MAIAAIHAADPADVAEITRIQAATWAVAYADLVPAAAIAQLQGVDAAQAWAAALREGAVFVATEGDWTVGFVAAGPADVPADSPLGPEAWGEIGTLLVEPRWGRRGHGGRLLAAAAEALRERGARYGLAWLPEKDDASRAFYARAGWEPDGTVRALDTGDGVLREVRFTGSLDLSLTP
ncbi:MAG: GNAT family N-acetyltransferase [Pseudonocardiales bacterium]|nr:GNAT family N-acetyltransferase [Pseudonocardiales bacterium]